MKDNIKFMGKFFKVVAIAVVFLLVVMVKSYAIDSNQINIDNISKMLTVEAQEDNSGNEEATAQPSEAATANTASTANTANTTNTTSTKASSASKDKMPATGSNAEIIFAVGAVILVSGVAYVYKKQSIKLK